MKKRIITGILTVVMVVAMLTGCTAFTHNYERDYKQVVAEIKAYDITVSVDKEEGEGKTTYTKHVEPKNIYKLDLVEFVSNNLSSLSQSVSNYQELYDTGLEMLINTELIVNEADALIEAGKIKWGLTQENAVKQRIYSVIDSTLLTLKNEILTGRDKPTISNTGDSTMSTETTYPTKPEVTDPEDEDVEDTKEWIPAEESEYPGNYGNSETRSLDKEALVRFIALLKERVKDDFRLTEEDKELFKKDDEEITRIIETDGVPYVYPYLGQSHYVYYVSGKSIERSQKLTELQNYFSEDVNINSNDVLDLFNKTLNSQKVRFENSSSAYDTAVSNGETVLYRPNNNYFYVKHILLPFSDAQKKSLENYKKGINVTKEMANKYRADLAENIKCYPHLYGEDDKRNGAMTVDDVMAVIKATMSPLANNLKAADVAFDDLIYLYNTDPGAFGNETGYVLKVEDEGDDQWVEEFAAAARKLNKEYHPGQVLYEKVVTDFGVHILYYASNTEIGEVNVYDYTTPGETTTYYEVFEEQLKTAAQNSNYQKWEDEALTYSFEKNVTIYEKRYKNLWEDLDK